MAFRKLTIASTHRPTGKVVQEQENNLTLDFEPVVEEVVEVTKKPTIFDTIKAVSATRPLTYRQIEEKRWPYEPFMVNRAFSLHEDAVKQAAVMNQHSQLGKAEQATYYIHSIRPRHRFATWPKLLSNPETAIIAKYYGMSSREAKLAAHIHTTEQVKVMQTVLDGGAGPSKFR